MCLDAEDAVERGVVKHMDCLMSVTWYKPEERAREDHSQMECMVQITGYGAGCTEKEISDIYGNKRRSGGGKIRELFMDPDNLCATITFESSTGSVFIWCAFT